MSRIPLLLLDHDIGTGTGYGVGISSTRCSSLVALDWMKDNNKTFVIVGLDARKAPTQEHLAPSELEEHPAPTKLAKDGHLQ